MSHAFALVRQALVALLVALPFALASGCDEEGGTDTADSATTTDDGTSTDDGTTTDDDTTGTGGEGVSESAGATFNGTGGGSSSGDDSSGGESEGKTTFAPAGG